MGGHGFITRAFVGMKELKIQESMIVFIKKTKIHVELITSGGRKDGGCGFLARIGIPQTIGRSILL